MNEILKEISWKRHSLSLFFLAVGLGLLILSIVLYMDKKQQLQIAQSMYQQQRALNLSAGDSLQILDDLTPIYQELKKSGAVGDAQRLQWIEITQNLSETLGIPLIEFTLDSSEPVTELNSAYWNPELEVQRTPMTLELDLRHEGEFLRLMVGLQEQAQGTFNVEKCDLRRNAFSAEENPELAGLKGKCSLIWYSISDVTEDWELGNR